MTGVPLAPRTLDDLVSRYGGALRNGARGVVRRLVPVGHAATGDLAPLLAVRYAEEGAAAAARGAFLLIDDALCVREDVAKLKGWFHPYAGWALAELLDIADAPADEPRLGEGCRVAAGAVLMPRVRLGDRVVVGPGAVIGAPGFGFVVGPAGKMREIPHVGGVIIEDDVYIGALATVAAGTFAPTVLRAGVKLDAQVHIGHNCEIGAGTIIAAQSGLAGSVVVGKNVLMGGQVGVADHLRIGDNARIGAKSGVIGDIPEGTTVAGYPAVERHRWLRGLAELYRLASSRSSSIPPSGLMRVEGFGDRVTIPPPVRTPTPPGIHPGAIIRRTERPPAGEGEGS